MNQICPYRSFLTWNWSRIFFYSVVLRITKKAHDLLSILCKKSFSDILGNLVTGQSFYAGQSIYYHGSCALNWSPPFYQSVHFIWQKLQFIKGTIEKLCHLGRPLQHYSTSLIPCLTTGLQTLTLMQIIKANLKSRCTIIADNCWHP